MKAKESKKMKRSLIISMVLTILVFSVAYAQEEKVPPYSAKECLKKIIEERRIVRVKIQNLIGHGYLNKGKIDEALAVFEKVLTDAQKIPGAELGRTYRYIGFTCSIKGEYSKAIDYLKEAVKYNPRDAEAHTLLGSAYYFTDNLDGAISQYKKVKKLDPNLLRARYYLTLDYEQKGEFDRTMREAKKLVRDHPKYGAGYVCLERAYKRRKMYEKALRANQKKVAYAPYFFAAHWNLPLPIPRTRTVVGYTPLGYSYLRKRDFDNAIAEFAQAIYITPSDTRAYLGLAEAYLGRGKVDMALEVTGEIWKISPDSFAAYSILRKIYWYETKRRLREVISLALDRVLQAPERPAKVVTEEKKVEPKVAKKYPKVPKKIPQKPALLSVRENIIHYDPYYQEGELIVPEKKWVALHIHSLPEVEWAEITVKLPRKYSVESFKDKPISYENNVIKYRLQNLKENQYQRLDFNLNKYPKFTVVDYTTETREIRGKTKIRVDYKVKFLSDFISIMIVTKGDPVRLSKDWYPRLADTAKVEITDWGSEGLKSSRAHKGGHSQAKVRLDTFVWRFENVHKGDKCKLWVEYEVEPKVAEGYFQIEMHINTDLKTLFPLNVTVSEGIKPDDIKIKYSTIRISHFTLIPMRKE